MCRAVSISEGEVQIVLRQVFLGSVQSLSLNSNIIPARRQNRIVKPNVRLPCEERLIVLSTKVLERNKQTLFVNR